MKRNIIRLFFVVAISHGAFGMDVPNDMRVARIEHAITGFRNVVSNDIATAYYDFAAILGEIKCVRPESERLRLIERLVSPLFDAQDNQWKAKDTTRMTLEKDYLLRLALASLIGDKYILFRWDCHLKRLQSMKRELSFYDDARNPDDVMREARPKLEKDLKKEYERQRTQSNDKVIIISGPAELPKEVHDARSRWGYKEWLDAHIKHYEKKLFDTGVRFRSEYGRLPSESKRQLMEMVHKELGRYPDWYLDERK